MAAKLFGDEDPIGQIVTVNDRIPLTVTGLIENPPKYSSLQFEYLLPFRLAPPYMKMWNNKAVEVYVKLHPEANGQDVSEKIANVYNIHNPNDLPNYLYLQPLSEMRLHKLGGDGGRITFIYIFTAMGIFVLLIACINFINLSTARSTIRAREIGIKKVMGSKRSQLFRQFMSESLFSSVVAFVCALFLKQVWLFLINHILHENLAIDLSWTTLLVFFGIILFTTLLSGLYPAIFLSSIRPGVTLKGDSPATGNHRSWFRRILVTAQFSLSVIFIIGITVIFSQLQYCKNSDLGYDKEHVVVLNLNGEASSKQNQIKDELLKNASVLNAAISTYGLARWNSSASIDWQGKRPDQIFDVGINRVDYDFQQTFQMEIAKGRFFSREFPSDLTDACVLNEAAISAMEVDDPVGRQVVWCKGTDFERRATIVGVLKNFHTESFHNEIRPFILFPTERGSRINVRIIPGSVRHSMSELRRIVKSIAPNYTFSAHFIDDEIQAQYQTERLTGVLMSYVAGIAIFITILGLVGLVSFSTERRTKEIGIRKALGATQQHILSLFTKEFTWLILIANMIAWPVAWYAADKWLQNFAFRVLLAWWIFGLAALVTLGLTFVTVSTHALRAASANPVDALRYE